MRFIYFLGALVAGSFGLFQMTRLPGAWHYLMNGNAHNKTVALGAMAATVLCVALVIVCLKKTFGPSRID